MKTTNYSEENIIKEQKNFLQKLRKEIKYQEFTLEHLKLENLIMSVLRKIKISSYIAKIIIPYLLTFCLTTGLFTALGETPFYRDSIKRKIGNKKEVEDFYNISYETDYNDTYGSIIKSFSKWNSMSNELYYRNIKTYSLQNISEDIISKLDNNSFQSLEDLLGEPILSEAEIKSNLSEEEIKQDAYLQTILYNENTYTVIKEPYTENIISTVIWLLLIIIQELAINKNRNNLKINLELTRYVININEKYKNINEQEIKKELTIKKNNYKYLTR